MHRFERNEILPDRAHPHVRPVLYNSWEATTFNVDEPGQKALAEKAAKLGVELFVMDDGWFGKRNDDHAGLGDWFVNPQKFPHGLQPLISYVNSLGMDFGLWFEPEMVNPDSDLYRHHPDWAMNFPGRPRSEARNQLGAQHGARGCEGIHLRRARQDAFRKQHQVHQVGHEPPLRRAGMGGSSHRGAKGNLGEVRSQRV